MVFPLKNNLQIPLILVVYFNLLGVNINFQLINKVNASELTLIAQNNVTQTKLTYDQYMSAGYEATNSQDFDQALTNFQEALKLRPEDEFALKAIRNLKSYVYDYYMEQGYNANNQREYEKALEYFQKALAERPNDFYAQQAIRNVQKTAQRQVNSTANNNKLLGINQPSSLLLILIFLMILIAIALVLVVVRLLNLKSSENKGENFPQPITNNYLTSDNSSDLKMKLLEDKQKNEQLNTNEKTEESHSSEQFTMVSVKKNASINSSDHIQELLSTLDEDDPKKRRKAIWQLAQKGDSRAVKPLVKIMLNANSYERTLILEALSQINSHTMKPMNQALLISLQDDNPQVRKNALRDVTKMYDLMSQIYPLINHTALNDPDDEVREIANWALEKFSFRENSPPLHNVQEEINATLITDDSQEN